MERVIIALLIGIFIVVSGQSYAATSVSATTTATVIAPLAITKVADLNFGTAIQGDVFLVLPPANASASVLNVTGQKNKVYTITLPASATMITGTGLAANQQILVNNFKSTPAAGANGLLSATGAQTLRVGATRAALLTNQVPGAYATSFIVNVIY